MRSQTLRFPKFLPDLDYWLRGQRSFCACLFLGVGQIQGRVDGIDVQAAVGFLTSVAISCRTIAAPLFIGATNDNLHGLSSTVACAP
jgi:hypothetical protein